MGVILDFLTNLFTKETKDTSVVVKNYISGNNNQRNNNGNSNNNSNAPKNASNKSRGPSTQKNNSASHNVSGYHQVELRSIRLYSTGAKGKVYTNKFYKSINHNFGIEVVLENQTSQLQQVQLGHCIYDSNGKTILKGNFRPKIKPHCVFTQDIYVDANTFAKMKNGTYKSQFWLNNTKVQKVYFTVTNK